MHTTEPVSGASTPEVLAPRRHDIQGLRAIASLLVATYHIWFGTVSGGVDLFFVVGGFLLVTSLNAEIARTGTLRVGAFLKRQASRLFPMAGLVLVVAGGWLLLSSPALAFARNIWDLFAAASYWENWRLAADATDYVASGHNKSIVQHFWAMSVQGQATLIFFVLFVAIAWCARKNARALSFLSSIALLVVAVASFVYALEVTSTTPVSAYYDTGARLWEFALGGFAAMVLTRIPLNGWLRAQLMLVGLFLVLSAGVLPSQLPYPGVVALWPAAGAVLILVAGAGGAPGIVSRILQSPPLVWLGGISYGLYLWSWPILKVYTELFPERAQSISLIDGVVLLALSIVASWLSVRLLGWIASVVELRGGVRRWLLTPVTAMLVPLVVVASFAGTLTAPGVHSAALDDLAATDNVFSSEAELAAAITASLDTPEYGNADVQLGSDAVAEEWSVDGCLSIDSSNKDHCRYGAVEASELVWVVGDSQAVNWAPGLRSALGDDVALQLMGLSMCPFTSGNVLEVNTGEFARECEAHNDWVVEQARLDRPDTVIVSFGAWWIGEERESFDGRLGDELASGSRDYIEQLVELGIDVVWLDAVPPSIDLSACAVSSSVEEAAVECVNTLDPEQNDRQEQLARAMDSFGARVVPTIEWFCDLEAALCPALISGTPVYSDKTHISQQFSRALSDILKQTVLSGAR